MLGWPGSWDERKTDKVWLGQPEANPFWKTWLLTFSLISFFFFLPSPVTRKIKTSSSSSLTTTNNKTVIWQKQSYSRSKKTFLHSASLFFSDTWNSKQFFFSVNTHTHRKHPHLSHHENIHTCTVKLKKKKRAQTVFFELLSTTSPVFKRTPWISLHWHLRFGLGGRGQEGRG